MLISDQPHIDKIRELLWTGSEFGRAAIMVGAGFSRNATPVSPHKSPFPSWFVLIQAMIDHIVSHGGDRKALELASRSVSGALRIAEEYSALHGRTNLDAFLLKHIPDSDFLPSPLHLKALELPWSDVFTTNWDTLLERAATRPITRRYSTVLQIADISRRMRPRIVKLHGSFPSNDPFILTEEDFRTYPRKFAPFVNLVQQAMMENVVCMVGFSGDDPNFLSWSGWVRDNMGRHTPRIYLCNILNLRSGERMVLEDRGVIPIDLSELFRSRTGKSVPESERHHSALNWFFDNLFAGKPPDDIKWPDPPVAAPEPDPRLPEIPPYTGPVPRQESIRT